MNLFFNPSMIEFQKLIRSAKNYNTVHDVVIDYDGEVLIDPQIQQPELDLDKFKVHVQINEDIQKEIDRKPGRLKNLFNSIMTAWNTADFAVTLYPRN